MSKLSIDISAEEYQQLKAMAATEGKSINTFVLDRLFEKENSEFNLSDNVAWEKLKRFLKYRIKHAEAGEISNKSIDQIAESVLKRHNVS